MTEKERILKMVESLPETVTTEDVMHELYVREVIERGLAEAEAGRTVSHEEAKLRLAKWLKP